MINLDQKQIAEKLAKFVWDFKVGDNIAYNFKTLFFLYQKKDEAKDDLKYLLNKPIAVTIVSVIEGIFYDLVCRLDLSKVHFPVGIDSEKRNKIKKKIDREKVWFTREDSILGTIQYKRIKNYGISELNKMFLEYELLGPKEDIIYKHIEEAAYLRNRVHIFNWFSNFETDEDKVYNDHRLAKAESLLVRILGIMEMNYWRPFDSCQQDNWCSKMNL